MQKIIDILKGIWETIKRTYARLLAILYTYCRETSSHINGKCRLEITSRCQFIEDLCARTGVHIPEPTLALPTSQDSLLRLYMATRFNWTLRITTYKGKITIKYLDIPIRRLVIGKAKDVADTITIWEKQISSYIETPKPAIIETKNRPDIPVTKNNKQSQVQKARRPVNVSSTEPPKFDKEEPETVNIVQVNGAIIDNSF